jgi:hypothetical protein
VKKVIDTLKAVAGIIDGAIQGEDDPCGKKNYRFLAGLCSQPKYTAERRRA